MAEFKGNEAGDNAIKFYELANEVAKDALKPTNIVRLVLALNYSIFTAIF